VAAGVLESSRIVMMESFIDMSGGGRRNGGSKREEKLAKDGKRIPDVYSKLKPGSSKVAVGLLAMPKRSWL